MIPNIVKKNCKELQTYNFFQNKMSVSELYKAPCGNNDLDIFFKFLFYWFSLFIFDRRTKEAFAKLVNMKKVEKY